MVSLGSSSLIRPLELSTKAFSCHIIHDAQGAIDPRGLTLTAQHDEQATVAKPPPFIR